MNINSFYNFVSKPFLTTLTFSPINLDAKKNEKIKLIEGEYDGVNFPIICKYERGKNIRDILDTGYFSLYLISDRFKKVLEEHHLTGWQSYPVKLFDKKGNEVSGYHGFSVTGRCGPIDYSRSEIIEKKLVPTGPVCKFYKGTYISLDKWDGSDFFLPENTVKIVITAKAAGILKDNKITNIDLENLSDEETFYLK